jgi:transposase-like protein
MILGFNNRLIASPREHVQILHPVKKARGLIGIWHKPHPSAKRLDELLRVTPAELPDAVWEMGGHADLYLTMNRFRGRRLVSQLVELDALWSDLDFHDKPILTPGGRPATADYILATALEALFDAKMPAPTLAISTGRGLLLTWCHDAIPRDALPKWLYCQARIYEILKHLGADPLAKDAARVFRLIGTRNSSAGRDPTNPDKGLVRALTTTRHTWDFNDLADEILPPRREPDIRSIAVARAKRPHPQLAATSHRFTFASLWENRLRELQAIRADRWWGGLPPGQRDRWLFLASTAISWLVPPAVMRREVLGLAQEAGGWTEKEARSNLGAVIRRASAAAAGAVFDFNGEKIDPRYRMKGTTMAEWLHVTQAEIVRLGLKHIVPIEARLERARKGKETRRRAEGVKPRSEYETHASNRQNTVAALFRDGKSTAEIAKTLGVDARVIRRDLKDWREDKITGLVNLTLNQKTDTTVGADKCVPLYSPQNTQAAPVPLSAGQPLAVAGGAR